MTLDIALFVSKRLMPVAAALLLLASLHLVQIVSAGASPRSAPPPQSHEVRVAIGR